MCRLKNAGSHPCSRYFCDCTNSFPAFFIYLPLRALRQDKFRVRSGAARLFPTVGQSPTSFVAWVGGALPHLVVSWVGGAPAPPPTICFVASRGSVGPLPHLRRSGCLVGRWGSAPPSLSRGSVGRCPTSDDLDVSWVGGAVPHLRRLVLSRGAVGLAPRATICLSRGGLGRVRRSVRGLAA
jgi:hypothetical protein